jgi:hypothetical protein
LRKHAARLLLFLDVMLDHLRQHFHFRIVVVVVRVRRLDLRDEILGAVVLHFRFVVDLLVIRRFEEGGIEDFLFDGGVHLECIADLRGEREFAIVIAGLLELFEPLLYLPMVGFEESDGIVAGRAFAACGLLGLGHGTSSSWGR